MKRQASTDLERILIVRDSTAQIDVGEELARKTGREPARGTMYVTLDRLERKGYLDSTMGEPTAERGGKSKRLYAITPDGLAALKRSGQALQAMWQGYESLLEDA